MITRPHGVRGALSLKTWNDDSRTLRAGVVVRVGASERRVAGYAAGVLTLDDVGDRTAAEALAGLELFARRADFSDGAFLVDLIGAPVVDERGAALGTASGFADNGGQPLMAVARERGEAVLVPFVAPIVVSAERARVVLRPPPGLFDDDALVDRADE